MEMFAMDWYKDKRLLNKEVNHLKTKKLRHNI